MTWQKYYHNRIFLKGFAYSHICNSAVPVYITPLEKTRLTSGNTHLFLFSIYSFVFTNTSGLSKYGSLSLNQAFLYIFFCSLKISSLYYPKCIHLLL